MSGPVLGEDDVRRVAKLAKLELAPAEVTQFRGQLTAILEAVAAMSGEDVSGVEPTLALAPEGPPQRADVVGAVLSPEEAVANAPRKNGTSFAVPRVIE